MNDTRNSGEPDKVSPEQLDALFETVGRSDAPGLVVGVAQHGKRLYRRGFGLASIPLGVANTAWTRMRIGSVSKHITCLAALLLAEDGKLDIEHGVRRYFPSLPLLEGEPTLRQLMTHTSGYRCYLDLGSLADGLAVRPSGQALAAQLRQGAVNFAPGEKMNYCNGGYQLLSLVIEQVAGMPFEQFLQERIFTPLGMMDTASIPSDLELQRGMATLHVAHPPELGGGWRRGIFPTVEIRGEGAVVSTVDDMLTWLAHMRASRKTVGSHASWELMTTRTILNSGLVIPYALGLMRTAYRGVDTIHHSGGVIGGSCQMITVPAHALDIVIMTNGAPVNPIELAHRIIDLILGDAQLGEPQAKAEAAGYQYLAGTRYHASTTGMLFSFAVMPEGQLGLSLLDNPPVAMSEVDGMLRLGFEDVAAGPLELQTSTLPSEGQAPAFLTLNDGGHAERYQRLPATAPALVQVGQALLGRYHAPDLNADAVMCFDGARLLLEVQGGYGGDVWELEAFGHDVFGIRFGGEHPPMRGVLCTERRDGAVIALVVNTPRTRHLRFERLAG